MTKQEADFIGSMNMCDEISNEAYKKIMCNCEVEESQPCEDCISREEAVNYFKENLIEVFDKHEVADEIHYNLPSVTPQQARWIPCSERMPEVSDYYLIQYSRHICSDEMAVAYYSVEEAESDSNYTWEFKPFGDCKEVIAWMPLPELYRESEE